MKVVSISLFALASALSISGVANAQSFDGPSVGALGGWVQNKLLDPETELGATLIDESKDSPIVGGFFGYDKTLGKFVLGAEAGINVGTSDKVTTGSTALGTVVDPKWSYDLTARAGYLVTPRTLVYARGGYANDRIETSSYSLSGAISASENRDGWLVGGGIERELTPHIFTRLEYRYSDLSEGDGTFDRHQTLLGVSYRF